jgi:hypothetical protein
VHHECPPSVSETARALPSDKLYAFSLMLRIRQKSDWLFFPWDLYASFDVFWLDLSNQPVGNTGWPEDISTNLAYFEV